MAISLTRSEKMLSNRADAVGKTSGLRKVSAGGHGAPAKFFTTSGR